MNRLARERSPYLLQHADNPVDWFPWGEEAFAKARADDKPIFLSIGYSTCHWCHVMEHESFESAAVAAVLNEHFVSIKVDREERPDVDRVYMTFVQATTGSGGWPMSVWLTPDLKPFYGGTYFPPSSQWGRPGFVDILQEIARVWRAERAKVMQSAEAMTTQLRTLEQPSPAGTVPGADALAQTVASSGEAFDPRHGGFGEAPKFPRPTELLFLLREHARTGDTSAADMVLRTLRAMALGGMRDHIGGGFHRYSVDGAWRVPHFEKMLYDQAQLVLAFVEAAQASGDPFYAEVAEDTLLYVMREMTDAGGGFYSAEDADSVPPEEPGARKKEGRVLSVARRRARRAAGRGRAHRQAAVRHRAGRQRAARSAAGVHRQESAVRRAVDRRHRSADRPRARRRRPDSQRHAAEDVQGAARPAAAAARRQDPDLVERPDDWRLRARVAGARRRRALPGGRPPRGGVRARTDVERGLGRAPSALPRRPRGDRRLRRGLRVSDPRSARAVSGGCRIRCGSSGRSRCSTGRTSCSGTNTPAAGSARPGAIRACWCA